MGRPTPLIPPPRTDIPLGEGRSVRLGAQLGRGSIATVYRGSVQGPYGLARSVAVKVFDTTASDEHEAVFAALAAAARRQACVRHPGVVRVEDFGLLGPVQPYAVLELVEGRTLAGFTSHSARRRERVSPNLALFVGCGIAEALAAARLASSPEGVRLGVVHGELSPSDVLLSWHGEVKVGDFAVAAAARAGSSVRSVRSLARRVRAMAPEVARGQPGDARSDVFSLGVMLRELLVGPRFPSFVSDGEALAWARDGIVHHGMFEPQLPQELQNVLTRTLERDPARRYPHAGALAFELRRIALAMGVGDARTFLRTALMRAFGDGADDDDEEVTGEIRMPRPSGVQIDRFARLRGGEDVPLGEQREQREERPALESGTVLAAGASEDDDAEEA